MTRKFNIMSVLVVFALVMTAVPALAAADPAFDDSQRVNATVTQQLIQVTVDTNTLAYGVVPLNNSATMPVNITNSGNGEEDLTILATVPTNGSASWNLADVIAAQNDCVWNVAAPSADPAVTNVNLKTSLNNLWMNVPTGKSALFNFKLMTPATSSGTGVYSMSATIQAATSY